MKKVLVTGVSGFIGHAMWHYLNAIDDVQCFGTSRCVQDIENVFACDLLDLKQSRELVQHVAPDVIFHFCGGRFDADKEMHDANLVTTENVMKIIKDLAMRNVRLIIPGSAAECGKIDDVCEFVDEAYACQPLSSYGKIKHQQVTEALRASSRQCEVIVGRMFNVLGPGVSSDLVAGRFAQQIVAIERSESAPVLETRSLDGYRDFLDIADVVKALWGIACEGSPGEIYNICSGQKVLIRELLQEFLSTAMIANITYVEQNDYNQKSFNVVGDNAKLKSLGVWYPEISFQESVRRTLDSYRNL